jgi:hypothetical protein
MRNGTAVDRFAAVRDAASTSGGGQRPEVRMGTYAPAATKAHFLGGLFAGFPEFADLRFGRGAAENRICRSSGFAVGSDMPQQGVIAETLGDEELA